ncbi:uncharacterized protein PHACADRAFT_263644 [Phanerochaete carnosa HHB-10118-sp]|uniref:Uncharacterized protein n=1 Tax=Phanerochaete carnosa (strain HHB-10118-sp) TaxID=650164 RepID=K5UL65_PHACS|nr:uncharacterized protein PHACADRAFT_263644 [Phanerochaete carnosa HHB-10118-sp]EKM50376.1 hypothetical protein PHACADRAFT_263644 [Phanerochaete carnosa HHB-10118-sp]
MQDGLARPGAEFFVQEELNRQRQAEKSSKAAPAGKREKERVVRLGRGLAPSSRVQSRVDLSSMWRQPPGRKRTTATYIHEDELHVFDEESEKEKEAFQARGRRAERQERTFAIMQGLGGVVQ